MEKVIRAVIQYSNSQLLDTLYTWQGVNNALLRDSLASQREERKKAEQAKKAAEVETAKLKDSLNEEEKRIKEQAIEDAKAEADKILEGFDDDLERLQKQVEELTRANEILQYENQGLKAKLNASDAQPVLFMGDEVDFYQGEIKDLLLSALTDALSNMPEKNHAGRMSSATSSKTMITRRRAKNERAKSSACSGITPESPVSCGRNWRNWAL